MATAYPIQTDDTLPASRIMREQDGHKAAWAQELARADTLERENAALRTQLDVMRSRDLRNIDDLTDLFSQQQARIAQIHDLWSAETSADMDIIAALNAQGDEYRAELREVNAQLESLRATHALLYAQWFSLQGTPYGLRAVLAEASIVNKDRLIAALRAELSDLKGALAEYESNDEEAAR